MIRPVERKVIVPQLPEKGGLSVLHRAVQQLAEAHNYHDDQLNKALRGEVSAANNNRVQYRKLRIVMPEDPPFILLPLYTDAFSWTNYGAGFYEAAYLMEPGGHVSIRGLINGGTPQYTTDGTFGTLPTGYAPGQQIGFATEGGNGAYGLLRAKTNGDLMFVFSAAVDPYAFLEPMHWIAPNAARPHPFVGSVWPMVVQHSLDACTTLDVVACRPESGSGTAGAPVADWEDLGNGRLRLNGIWGLQWGATYNLTVRLSSEA